MQLKIKSISSGRVGVLYLICDTSNKTHIIKNTVIKTKPKAERRPEPRTQENHKQDLDAEHHVKMATDVQLVLDYRCLVVTF